MKTHDHIHNISSFFDYWVLTIINDTSQFGKWILRDMHLFLTDDFIPNNACVFSSCVYVIYYGIDDSWTKYSFFLRKGRWRKQLWLKNFIRLETRIKRRWVVKTKYLSKILPFFCQILHRTFSFFVWSKIISWKFNPCCFDLNGKHRLVPRCIY